MVRPVNLLAPSSVSTRMASACPPRAAHMRTAREVTSEFASGFSTAREEELAMLRQDAAEVKSQALLRPADQRTPLLQMALQCAISLDSPHDLCALKADMIIAQRRRCHAKRGHSIFGASCRFSHTRGRGATKGPNRFG